MKKWKTFLLALSLAITLFLSFSTLAQAGTHLHPPFSCSAVCVPVSPFVREEHLPENQLLVFPELQDGDILLTDCAHTFGWRHGHAALVVDGANQHVLEAITLGACSSVRSVAYWKQYPKVTVLRLKGANPSLRHAIATQAVEVLSGIPYHLTSGLWGKKYPDSPTGSQCAYLIWYAYRQFGYDLDSDGGRLVTVNDLLCSSELETVAVLTGSP